MDDEPNLRLDDRGDTRKTSRVARKLADSASNDLFRVQQFLGDEAFDRLFKPIIENGGEAVSSPQSGISRRNLLWGALGTALGAGGMFVFNRAGRLKQHDESRPSVPAVTPSPNTSGPIAETHLDTRAIASGDVLVFYERGAEGWMQKAADGFSHLRTRKYPDVPIRLDHYGSREGFQKILFRDAPMPLLWNPADVTWIVKLNRKWKEFNHEPMPGSGDVATDRQIILKTKLVLVMDKALALEYRKTKTKTSWAWLLIVLINNKLRLIQANPLKSNSGVSALSLMLNEYRQQNRAGKQSDPEYIRFMVSLEKAAERTFVDTTSLALEEYLKAPAGSSICICYEANVIDAIRKYTKSKDAASVGKINVVYPHPTDDILFSIARLNYSQGAATSQDITAQEFIQHLISAPVQLTALEYGFRPIHGSNADVDKALKEQKLVDAGVETDPTSRSRVIDDRLINKQVEENDELIYQWLQNVL